MAELELSNGATIQVRDRFPLETDGDILGVLTEASLRDMSTCIPLLTRTVTAWDRDGEPADAEAWQQMDVFEIYPYARRVIDYMTQRMFGDVKNEASASS